MKETVCVFTCFSDKSLRVSDPDIAADRFQDAAYGNSGIHIAFEQDMGNH